MVKAARVAAASATAEAEVGVEGLTEGGVVAPTVAEMEAGVAQASSSCIAALRWQR